MEVDDVCYGLLKELRTEVTNHEIVVDHIVDINDVEQDVIERVDVKVKDEDARNMHVGNLLKDEDHVVLDIVSLQVVGEVAKVNRNVNGRGDDELTKVVTVDPNVVVTLDVSRTADDEILMMLSEKKLCLKSWWMTMLLMLSTIFF